METEILGQIDHALHFCNCVADHDSENLVRGAGGHRQIGWNDQLRHDQRAVVQCCAGCQRSASMVTSSAFGAEPANLPTWSVTARTNLAADALPALGRT